MSTLESSISNLESTKQLKLLCVVGPTGTGKTKLAIELAKRYPSVLISADSRQVYKGMDIVTGKDHPAGIDIQGIDIADPNEDCSVATWYDAIAPSLVTDALPIVVGGTGLYVRAITDGIDTMKIPPNEKLRNELEILSLSELQQRLLKVDTSRWESMNESDRSNPRRLIRAIEVALSHQTTGILDHQITTYNSLLIGLKQFDNSNYRSIIKNRVVERLHSGAIEETKKLLTRYDQSLPSMTAIGYRSIIRFLKAEISEQELIEYWTDDEVRYAKRQLTWFRKVPGIHWFDPAAQGTSTQVAQLVSSWYD